ncbi:MAG: hypothetical protein KBS83_04800 [Lachnospiraceae bacterium]|nr:hypothetical protein [Candidatus Equihabitans merdae]
MDRLNYLYPCGEDHDSYLEYQMCCHACGKAIHIFLPTQLKAMGYSTNANQCHSFLYSINRGFNELFPDQVIKLRNDVFGNSYLLFDNYHLYPLIAQESPEERKARLIRIKQAELAARLGNHSEKKQWIIQELVSRNDTILNALEDVMKVYEKTEQTGWDKLDQALTETTLQDDAISLLQRFGLKTQESVQPIQSEAVSPFFVNAMGSDDQFFTIEEQKAEPPKPIAQSGGEEWICSCGTKSSKKFCPNCGLPKDQ